MPSPCAQETTSSALDAALFRDNTRALSPTEAPGCSTGCAAPAVGDKRDDCLCTKVIFFKEGVDRHGHIGPPVGVSQQDELVLLGIFNMSGKLRASACLLFLCGLIHQRIVVQGIGIYGFNAEQIASNRLLDELSHIFRVTQHFAVIHDDTGSGHRIYAVRADIFRDRKIGNQNVASGGFLLYRGWGRRGCGLGGLRWVRAAAGGQTQCHCQRKEQGYDCLHGSTP